VKLRPARRAPPQGSRSPAALYILRAAVHAGWRGTQAAENGERGAAQAHLNFFFSVNSTCWRCAPGTQLGVRTGAGVRRAACSRKATPRTPDAERGSRLREAGARGRGVRGARGLKRRGGAGAQGCGGAGLRGRGGGAPAVCGPAHHDRVVLAQGEALGHVFWVLARDIEEARARAAQQLDEDRLHLPLGHSRLSPPPTHFCSEVSGGRAVSIKKMEKGRTL
jgi:hypothetical protein